MVREVLSVCILVEYVFGVDFQDYLINLVWLGRKNGLVTYRIGFVLSDLWFVYGKGNIMWVYFG